MIRLTSICIAIALRVAVAIACQHSGAAEAFLSPEDGGRDYALQGEFAGTIEAWGGAFGAQVVALGDDEFEIVFFPGGLPGDGYRREVSKKSLHLKADGDVARGDGDGDVFAVKLTTSALSILDAEHKSLAELPKIMRQSPTLGAQPPKGALVLFDGSSISAFRNGRMSQDKNLEVGCESLEKFGDHQLHIEFRTPFMPAARGQKRGNSGVYLQGRYEVQVLDSFGLEGKDNECGGIYKVAQPNINMCFPPLSWQTYDIDFRAATYDARAVKTSNATVSIRHNGVVIHQNLELPSHTPGKNKEAAEPGVLFLQNHQDPVVYRNVWVVKK